MTFAHDEDDGARPGGSIVRQSLIGLVVTSSCLVVGMNEAWPSVLPKMQSDPDVSFSVTEQDVSWLVSLSGIVGMITTLVTGPLMEFMGPQKLLLLILLPTCALWLLLAFGPGLVFLYISRVGLSVITYAISTFIQLFVAELCEASIRGAIASLVVITSCIGMLSTYIAANFLDWKVATALCAAPFLPLFILMNFVPESPYWLMKKGKTEEAKASLARILGPKADIDRALQDIPTAEGEETSPLEQIKLLGRKENLKSVSLVLVIFLLRELSGHNSIFFYSVFIFQRAGVELDAFLCTVLVGCVKLIFAVIAVATIDCIGRRICFISTTVICFLAQMFSGTFLLFDVTGTTWVPVFGVLLYVAAHGLGQGSIPWVLLGELLPMPVRGTGASVIIFLNCLLLFGVNFVFLKVMRILGVGGILCLFSLFNVALAVISYFWLPETKGQLLKDLGKISVDKTEVDIVPPKNPSEKAAYERPIAIIDSKWSS